MEVGLQRRPHAQGRRRGQRRAAPPQTDQQEQEGKYWARKCFLGCVNGPSKLPITVRCYNSNNCTGMIGRVNRGEADFALGLYVMNLEY